ncbi:hypothetical protein CLU79DRAFT_136802 [Phycomyces nitens]|nr:hypothetical protein CLU79DRAFT_136802 [Phycomyces nitens]
MNLYSIVFILILIFSQTVLGASLGASNSRPLRVDKNSCIEITYPVKRVTWKANSFHIITWNTIGKCSQPKSIFLINNTQNYPHVPLFHNIDVSLGYGFVFIPTNVKQKKHILAIGTEHDNRLVSIDSKVTIDIALK